MVEFKFIKNNIIFSRWIVNPAWSVGFQLCLFLTEIFISTDDWNSIWRLHLSVTFDLESKWSRKLGWPFQCHDESMK